jgi:hypothetical protein
MMNINNYPVVLVLLVTGVVCLLVVVVEGGGITSKLQVQVRTILFFFENPSFVSLENEIFRCCGAPHTSHQHQHTDCGFPPRENRRSHSKQQICHDRDSTLSVAVMLLGVCQ